MGNWTSLIADDLKTLGHGAIVDRARTAATGGIDPVPEAIAEAVARVRRAISSGNTLDADTAKVPMSLKAVAIRLALFSLMERIRLPLSDDQKETRRNDLSDLNRIHDSKQRVEVPDDPRSGTAEMQTEPAPKIHRRHREFTRWESDGV